jgi:hypothetical protein
MRSAELKVDYSNLDKPFELVERVHDMGGTDYYPICRLSEGHARLLHAEGISWLYGEPNWKEHYRLLAIRQTEAVIKEANEKLDKLKGVS